MWKRDFFCAARELRAWATMRELRQCKGTEEPTTDAQWTVGYDGEPLDYGTLRTKDFEFGYINPHLVMGILEQLEATNSSENSDVPDVMWDWCKELFEY